MATIEHGNQLVPSPEASAESVRLMHKLLVTHRVELHLQDELVIPDSLQLRAKQEIYRAVEGYRKMPALGHRGAFTRSGRAADRSKPALPSGYGHPGLLPNRENYSNQLAKSIGMGLLTMGMLVPIATKAKSIICLFIHDSQQKTIVDYNHTTPPAEREPLDEVKLEY